MPPGATLTWQHPARLLRLAVLVGLCCWASIALTRGDGRVAAIWLSNGLVIGLLLSNPSHHWRGILVAGFAGNLVANLLSNDTPQTAFWLTACNSLEMLVAAWPLRRRFGEALDLTSAMGLIWFAAFGILLAPMLSALMAALLLSAQTGASASDIFSVWFPADAMGVLIITPLVLALRAQADLEANRLKLRRALLPWLLVVVSSVLVFSQSRYPLLFLVFPPLLVLTYMQGLTGTVLGVATVTVISVLGTINGHGPFMLIDTPSMHTRILVLQVFVMIAAAQGLVVGMLLAQRERLTLALRRSEQSLRTITDNLPALIAYLDTDERYRFANAHIGKILGDDPAAMLGRSLREVRGETVYADISPRLKRALAGETVSFESAGLARGQSYHYQSNYIPDITTDGRVQGVFAMTFDITARKNAELQQAADEERLRTITDNLPALIAYLDQDGIYRFCNQTHEDWFGKPVSAWVGQHYSQVMDAAFAEAQATHIDAALRGGRVNTELALSNGDCDRILRASYVPHHSADGRVMGLYLLMNDITSLKTVQAQLSHLARYDTLTGLANRREFQERLETTLSRNRRTDGSHALMFLDIDHFKHINDTRGHAAGDAVLREIATRLQASVRNTDTVARLAGDEFVVILDGLGSAEESQFIARKIIAAMERPVRFETDVISVGVSIGIAHDGASAFGPDELLSLADGALYQAKAAGRNTWRMADGHTPSQRAKAAA